MIVHVRFIGSPLGTDSSLGQPNTPKNLIPMSSEFGNGQDFEHSNIIVFGCSGEAIATTQSEPPFQVAQLAAC
jgi:hypothetical protein